ncbi:MAG: PIF1 family DEAD/DEAH box helicase [Candidatus Omnitrophota bacterium]
MWKAKRNSGGLYERREMIAKNNNSRNELPRDLDLNDEFRSAFNSMEKTDDNLFITGKAGTGKSTLLKYFKIYTGKRIVILAPTGVAAVNVGGQTIHSFFKFPPRILQKDTIRKRRDTDIIEKLDTVIIDEVSMVRADLMDGIDYALRLNRGQMKKPFGGVQMIFFGDLFQLPPVVDPAERELLAERYPNPYFFSAKVFHNSNLRHIELSRIYRQKDKKFIELLNRLRNKEHTDHDLGLLNGRYLKSIPESGDATVILTTTNSIAAAVNENRLAGLQGKEYSYEGDASGDIKESFYPTNASLRLKKGAQVILIKNDPDKQWVNGTIARIASLSRTSIKVDIDGQICEVNRVKWQKIEYSYNEDDDKIEEDVVGAFEQYPIKLAWAITIHKSQGQTFDKIIVDLGRGAFTHGQVYVALSRCSSLEGITLKRPVINSDIIFDKQIYEFQNRFASLGL